MAFTDIFSGILGTGVGLWQQKKAQKALNALSYPTESVPREILENQGIAENMANTGMPQDQYNNAMKSIQRQQMASLRAAQDRRGGLSALAGLTQATNDAMDKLYASDAEARMQNQRQLLGVNSQVAGVKRDLFDKNVRDRYNRDYGYNMQLKGQGWQNLMGGVDKIGAGIFGGLDQLMNMYTGGLAGMAGGGGPKAASGIGADGFSKDFGKSASGYNPNVLNMDVSTGTRPVPVRRDAFGNIIE